MQLDESQQAALEAAFEQPVTLVLGAPGSGKTTLALELAAAAVEQHGVSPDSVLVLGATRRGAGHLRDTLAARLGLTVRGAVVRTAPSAAFTVLTARAQAAGEPAPTLVTGPEQDLVLGELLAGHAAGEGVDVGWPATVPAETLELRGFREELRDLLMRAAERGLGPEDLVTLGRRHSRPEWVAAGRLYEEYLAVMALRGLTPDAGERYDPAGIVDEAARTLETWEADDRPRWDLVVVDDYQEATAATARLCHVLAGDGARLVLLADPDTSAQAFRGATPALVGRASAGRPPTSRSLDLDAGSTGELGAEVHTLGTVWRHGAVLRDVVRSVTQEIGSVGAVEHRRAPARSLDAAAAVAEASEAGSTDRDEGTVVADRVGAADSTASTASTDGTVETAVLPSPALEEAHVAKTLRAEHLVRGTAWSQMAVVARSGSELVRLRRALGGAGVPVAVVGTDVPLRDEPAVRPLLRALRASATGDLAPEVAVELLTSPLGGIDAVGLRRLRRALRGEELAGGGGRTSDALLVEALGDPARVVTLPSDVVRAPRRVARVLEAGRAALEAPGANAQTVLWALWAAADVAETWRSIAVNGGPGAARADRDLDAVMAVFRAAETFVERVPQATAVAFADHVESQDLPADTLAKGAAASDTVQLLTPAGAAGGEWEVVVVAGVQDGTWPDLRLRDSMLGSQALVDVLSGRSQDATSTGRDARRAVLADELRAFAVAVSRASRRLVVTAVRDVDSEPSVFVDLVSPDDDGSDTEPPDVFAAPLDLRGVVSTLRTELAAALSAGDSAGSGSGSGSGSEGAAGSEGTAGTAVPASTARAASVAGLLARLAGAGVGEADPTSWYGSAELSTPAALRAPDESVPVSPSKVEQVHRCALRWALESAGGTAGSALSQSVGNLVHDIARELPAAGHAELAAELDRRWHELGMPDGWPATQTRRRADAMVRRLADYYTEISGEVLVEESFEVQVGRAVLRGSVDRLERSGDDGVRVTDLKTGRGIPSVAEAATNAQLGAYQLAVESGAFPELGPGVRSVGAQLVFVGDGARGATRRTQEALETGEDSWARTLVTEAAETMAGSRFRAVENSMCATCGVRRACPVQNEGRHVVDLGMPAPAERDER